MPRYSSSLAVPGAYNVPAGTNITGAGKYGRVITVSSAPYECTGSSGGVVAVVNSTTTAAYTLIGGGSATGLAANTIHEISPRTVTSVGGGTVYLYYRY